MFKIVRRISLWTGKDRNKIFKGYVFSFFQSIFTGLPIMIAALGLKMVLDDFRGLASLDTKIAFYELIALLVCVVARAFFSYKKSVYQESVGFKRGAEERVDVGNVLKRVSLGYFTDNSTGTLSSTVTSELNLLENYSMKMINLVVNGYITTFTMLLFIAYKSLHLAFICIVGIVLSGLVLKILGDKSASNALVRQKTQEDMTSATIEYIRGLSIVKAFSGEGLADASLRSAYSKSREINVKIELSYTPLNCLHLLILKVTSMVLVMAVSYQTLQNQLDLTSFLMITIFSFIIFEQVEGMNEAVHILRNLDKTMDQIENIKNGNIIDEEGRHVVLDSYDIEFENVTFAYDKTPIINQMNLHIPENKTTAIVGPSGSGKSTICHLIARFYDVQEGSVRIGGRNIKNFTCDSLLRNISMVFQKVYLFNDTIMSNIRFGMPGATDEEVISAAQKARCHEFIMKLPQGYNTVVGEGGSSLSGGEKQRISIARAILKNAPIIILDEATASVDPENEHYIQQAIGELTKGKTIIVIAHRLATIENADQIIVVNEGRVHDSGHHTELIQKDGIYKNFINIRKQTENWKIETPA